jgi:tetratricopeptide (TPR) repeat protein
MKKIATALLLTSVCWSSLSFADVNQEISKGNQLWVEGKLDEAAQVFTQATTAYPKSALAHERLAALLLTQQKLDESVDAYQNAIVNDPTNPKLFVALALVYMHQQSYAMANGMVEQALSLKPDMPQAQKMAQYIKEKRAMLAEAEKAAKAAEPENTPAETPTELE